MLSDYSLYYFFFLFASTRFQLYLQLLLIAIKEQQKKLKDFVS